MNLSQCAALLYDQLPSSRFDEADLQGLGLIVDYLMSQTEFPISLPYVDRKNQV